MAGWRAQRIPTIEIVLDDKYRPEEINLEQDPPPKMIVATWNKWVEKTKGIQEFRYSIVESIKLERRVYENRVF